MPLEATLSVFKTYTQAGRTYTFLAARKSYACAATMTACSGATSSSASARSYILGSGLPRGGERRDRNLSTSAHFRQPQQLRGKERMKRQSGRPHDVQLESASPIREHNSVESICETCDAILGIWPRRLGVPRAHKPLPLRVVPVDATLVEQSVEHASVRHVDVFSR